MAMAVAAVVVVAGIAAAGVGGCWVCVFWCVCRWCVNLGHSMAGLGETPFLHNPTYLGWRNRGANSPMLSGRSRG